MGRTYVQVKGVIADEHASDWIAIRTGTAGIDGGPHVCSDGVRDRRVTPLDETTTRVAPHRCRRSPVGPAVLLRPGSRGDGAARDLPEHVAAALIATARTQRDTRDRAALRAYRAASRGCDRIVALIQQAVLAPDDLDALRAALDEREQGDQL
jgi:hypothetical protein